MRCALVNRYRVDRVLGQGGMGVVLAGEHIQLQQAVAIKLMLAAGLASGEAVTRFLREARAAASIQSEHVVRVFDVGSLETGEPYMAMEYLDGEDLGELLRRRGPLPVPEVVEYVLQGLEALAEAHHNGIIHRDLKPGNLFLVRRPNGTTIVKVLDFGISKVTGADAPQSGDLVTKTSALMGSPLYMSPEQMRSSRNVDARSDIWALGTVLYEVLTGKTPFNADTLPQVCTKVMAGDYAPVTSVAPDVPAELAAVIHRCMTVDPDARFQNVAELAVALLPFAPPNARQSAERIAAVLDTALPAAPPERDDTPPTVQAATGTEANWGETRPELPTKRSRAGLLAVASVALLGVVGAGVWFVSRVTTEVTSSDVPASAPVATDEPQELSGAQPIEERPAADPEPPPSASAQPPEPTVQKKATPKPTPKQVTAKASPRTTAPTTKPAPIRAQKPTPKTQTTLFGKPGERSRR